MWKSVLVLAAAILVSVCTGCSSSPHGTPPKGGASGRGGSGAPGGAGEGGAPTADGGSSGKGGSGKGGSGKGGSGGGSATGGTHASGGGAGTGNASGGKGGGGKGGGGKGGGGGTGNRGAVGAGGGSGGTVANGGDAGVAGSPDGAGTLVLTLLTAPGEPVGGVKVVIDGVTRTSDAAGKVTIGVDASGTKLAHVTSPDYAEATLELDLKAGAAGEQDVWLAPRRPPIKFDAARGLTWRDADAGISIPPHAIVDAQGVPVTGSVAVRLAVLPGTTEGLKAAPGPFVAVESAQELYLDSMGMLEVTLWQGDAPLQLAPGAHADLALSMPAARLAEVPVGGQVPAWSFDTNTARWKSEGDGTIAADPRDGGARLWLLRVSHFTWFNCDWRLGNRGGSGGGGGGGGTGISCLHVSVVDDANSAPISASYTVEAPDCGCGAAHGNTEGSATACAPQVPANQRLIVTAVAAGYSPGASEPFMSGDPGVCGDSVCAEVTVRLQRANCLSGHVEDDSGFRVGQVSIVAHFATLSNTGSITQMTAGDSTYCLTVPVAATVTVSASRERTNYTEYSEEETVRTPATPASCGGGDCTSVPTLRLASACVRGHVQNDAGAAVPDATVIANFTQNGTERQSTIQSDGSGDFCLPAPMNLDVDVHAETSTGDAVSASDTFGVHTDDVAEGCGTTVCTDTPTLVIHDPACIEGQVQDPDGNPATEATVTGDLGSAYGFREVSADPDEYGNYCLEVPPGASVVIRATDEIDGLPVESNETITAAPSLAAECGSGQCASAALLQLPGLHCVAGRVVDQFGTPWPGVAVQVERQRRGQDPETVDLVTGNDGSYCAPVSPRSLARIEATRSAGAVLSSAKAEAIVPLGVAGCGGACVGVEDLVLPVNTCVVGEALISGGALANNVVGLVDAPGVPPTATDSNAVYCLDLPQAPTAPALTLRGSNAGYAVEASMAGIQGSELTCATNRASCATGPILSLLAPTCLQGTVEDANAAPVTGAEVSAHYRDLVAGPKVVSATTGGSGSYCLNVPPDTDVDLVARAAGSSRLAAATSLHTVPGAATCGGAGTCTAEPPLTLAATTSCVRGTAVVTDSNRLSQPFPAGTPVYAYDFGVAPNCGTAPATWGALVAQSTVAADGSFCVEVPGFPHLTGTDPGKVSVQVGDCNFFSGTTAACVAKSNVTSAALTTSGRCPSTCQDLGLIAVDTHQCGIAP